MKNVTSVNFEVRVMTGNPSRVSYQYFSKIVNDEDLTDEGRKALAILKKEYCEFFGIDSSTLENNKEPDNAK